MEEHSVNTNCFFKIGIHSMQAEQPLQGMELQEKGAQKDYSIQEICLERIHLSVSVSSLPYIFELHKLNFQFLYLVNASVLIVNRRFIV